MKRTSISVPGFSHSAPVPTACMKNGLVITGGISGLDPSTGRLPEALDEQCKNVFQHMRAVMERAGGSVDDIVKVEVWLPDLSDKTALNREWLAMFPDPESRPTRHAFSGARDFDPNVKIVCNLLAVLDT